MVYMMSSARANRLNKEKLSKNNTTHKSEGPPQKHQPSSEQMRMAQMTKSTNKSSEDPVVEAKIEQVAELTGRTKDEACFALHDCDYDLNRAVEKLFESEVQEEWQEMKTKKKKSASKSESEPTIEENHVEPVEMNNHKSERDFGNDGGNRQFERSANGPRGRRNDKAPPRFQRAGRGRTDDDRGMDRGDSGNRERGRGRGRGGSSRGRGRGRGGTGSRRDDRGRNNYDDGPGLPIDTWTNDVAEESSNKKKNNTFGNWGDMSEDWATDEWQGSLKESTVFTSSVNNDNSKMFNDNDAKMFSVNNIETQAFNNSLSNSMPSPSRITDSYPHSGASMANPNGLQNINSPTKPIGQNAIGQNSLGQAPIGQNSLGQRLDLGILLSAKPNEYKTSDYSKPVDSVEALQQQTAELTKETAHFMAQFQKNLAAESIKNAVGIGNTSSQGASLNLGQASGHERPSTVQSSQGVTQPPQPSQPVPTAMSNQQQNSAGTVQPKQQRQPLRSSTKLPPPSKIPASAVVMPGAGSSNFGANLDVEFGCFSESPGGFSFGSLQGAPSSVVNNVYTSSGVSHKPANEAPPQQQQSAVSSVMTSSSNATHQSAAVTAMLENIAQQQSSQSPRPAAVFQNSNPATPSKDYSQSAKISSPPDPIPFPNSQADRKSPYQPGLQNYKASSFQSQTQVGVGGGYSSAASHQNANSSLYPGASQKQPSGSAFQTGQSSYQQPAQHSQSQPQTQQKQPSATSMGANAGSSNPNYPNHHQSAYSLNRESQSAPAFQSATGTSSSTYPNSVGVGQTSGNTSAYQRDGAAVTQQSAGSVYNSQLVSSYGASSSASEPQSSSSKLSESLGKLTVNDASSNSVGSTSGVNSSISGVVPSSLSSTGPGQYDVISSNSGAVNSSVSIGSMGVSTNTTSSTVASVTASAVNSALTNVSVNSAGVVSSHPNMPLSKSSLPLTTKAPVNLPPGMPPLIGHQQTPNYVIGQPGFPIAAFGLQQPLYSYEDLLHQRLPMHNPNAAMSGIDQNKLAQVAAAASYSGTDVSKLPRLESHSPVNATQTSQANVSGQHQTTPTQQNSSQQNSTSSATPQHGQAYIPNPTAGLTGYYNYYLGGLPQPGYSYPTPFLPVNNMMPTVTNSGVTTANTQFQKQAYNYTTGYDSLSALTGQTHDYKAYGAGGVSQSQNKTSVNAASFAVSSPSDLTSGSGSSVGYPKPHQQATAYDKSAFAAGTPPPFPPPNLPPGLSPGTQAGAALGGNPYMTQYPLAAAQAMAAGHPAPMIHQLHQDSASASSSARNAQQSNSQATKSLVGPKVPGYSGYWAQ